MTKKRASKVLALLLALVMCIGMLPFQVLALGPNTEGEYVLPEDAYVISGTSTNNHTFARYAWIENSETSNQLWMAIEINFGSGGKNIEKADIVLTRPDGGDPIQGTSGPGSPTGGFSQLYIPDGQEADLTGNGYKWQLIYFELPNDLIIQTGDKLTLTTDQGAPGHSLRNIEFTVEGLVTSIVSYEYVGDVPQDAPLPPSSAQYKEGNTVTVADPPTLDGWIFSGWTTAANVQFNNNGTFTMPAYGVHFTGSWTYTPAIPDTIEIDIHKRVVNGGATTPPAETFEFELFDFGASNIDMDKLEISGNTVATEGAGDYTTTLLVATSDLGTVGDLTEGFFLREKKGTAANWTYSDEVYFIAPYQEQAPRGEVTEAAVEPSTSDWFIYPTTISEDGTHYVPTYEAVDVAFFTNTYTKTGGSAVLIKVDKNDNNAVLSNAKFELYGVTSNGSSLVDTYTTNIDGKITVYDLSPGSYYWQEIGAPEGYTLDSAKHEFTVENNNTATVTVENSKTQAPDVFSTDHYAYIIGYNDGLVHPEAKITRAEVATIFFRLLSDEVRDANLTKTNSFSDVASTAWYNTAVSTMAKMGVINGYPDGRFGPNDPITRAEFVAIAARLDTNGNTADASFTDIHGHWAMKEISIAANNGWVLGYVDGTFKPDQQITRAEAMAMVNRVLQRIPESKDDLLTGMVTWPDNMNATKWYYLMVQEATNSHYYERKTNGYEYWTDLRPVRDWAELEK